MRCDRKATMGQTHLLGLPLVVDQYPGRTSLKRLDRRGSETGFRLVLVSCSQGRKLSRSRNILETASAAIFGHVIPSSGDLSRRLVPAQSG